MNQIGARGTDPRAGYIAIATRQFAAQGFEGTSLSALAREAKVSKQALLHFFGTKEALYSEVLAALSDRLLAALDRATSNDPCDHLSEYFLTFQRETLKDGTDVRLVVRALLDSHSGARKWPLKPYLDVLIQIAHKTPGGAGQPHDTVLAWLAQVIGMIQYGAISTVAVSGMYGKQTANAVAQHSQERLRHCIDVFLRGA